MLPKHKIIKINILSLILLLLISGFTSAQDRLIELQFGELPDSKSDTTKTIQSLIKVQGEGGICQDGLYLLTNVGDREDLFFRENQRAIKDPLINHTWRFCSVFSIHNDNSVLMGRNWDNQNVGSIIVNLYYPTNGFSSISFSRAIDLGFPLNMDLEKIKSSELGNRLLLAPFYAMDGINEHGVAVAVAGLRQTTHKSSGNKQKVCVTFLMRKILDQTKSIDEAVKLIEKYVPFDLDKNSLNAHFIITDSSGRSVILEYDQDQWRIIDSQGAYQILTTKQIYNVPEATLIKQCWRYRNIFQNLKKTNGDVDWNRGIKILQDVQQKGTTWSAVYSTRTTEVFFTVYQNWDTIYHLRIPQSE
jgi:hypothetical protein